MESKGEQEPITEASEPVRLGLSWRTKGSHWSILSRDMARIILGFQKHRAGSKLTSRGHGRKWEGG